MANGPNSNIRPPHLQRQATPVNRTSFSGRHRNLAAQASTPRQLQAVQHSKQGSQHHVYRRVRNRAPFSPSWVALPPAMATPELAIAKAALSASLFRADPTSTSRPAVDDFIQLLTSTLMQCSRSNVQVRTVSIYSNI